MFTIFLASLAGAIAGGLIVKFWDQILDWARSVINRVASWVKKAWVYIQRIPGAIKQFVRFIKDGDIYEETTTRRLTDDEIYQMYLDGELSYDDYQKIMSGRKEKFAEFEA